MQQKTENSDHYRAQRFGGETNQDTLKVEGLHEGVTTKRICTEMSTSSFAIGPYIHCIENVRASR